MIGDAKLGEFIGNAFCKAALVKEGIGNKERSLFTEDIFYLIKGNGQTAVFPKILYNTLGLSTNETAATAFLRETHLALEASKLPGLLYRPATFVWLVLLALAVLICKRRSKLAAPMFFLLGLWLTTLLSPVYAETRYLYGVMISAPIYLGIALTESPQKDKAS